MTPLKSLQELVHHKQVRSADRANMKRLLQRLKRGQPLTYQERLNLEAYLNRYRAYLSQEDRNAPAPGIE